jgi:predicted phosphoribosyltransferase
MKKKVNRLQELARDAGVEAAAANRSLSVAKIGVINEEKAMLFQNREHAARLLALRLSAYYKNKNPLVLAIPRGAIGMAEIIADALGGELDVVLVHKLGAPGQPELAIGAIDEAGNSFLSGYGSDIDDAYLEAETQTQLEILRKRRAQYTPSRGAIDPHDRIVIVVDDGIATGSTMTAALRSIRKSQPKKLVGAVAVASPTAARAISREADAIVCLEVPVEFYAVGEFFADFAQGSDEDVIAILEKREAKISAVS